MPAPRPKKKIFAENPAAMGVSIDDLMAAQERQQGLQTTVQAGERTVMTQAQQAARAAGQRTVGLMHGSRAIMQESHASHAAADASRSYLMQDQDELMRIEEEAIRLSNSPNISDRFTLYFKQLQDPRYTMEYNHARMNKIVQTSGVVDTLEAVRQQAYARQLDKIKADFDITNAEADLARLPAQQQLEFAKLLEAQGATAIDSLMQVVNERATFMQNQLSMQDSVIANMSSDQIYTARDKAALTPDESINIGGVDITPGQLEAAVAAAEDRDFLEATRKATQASTDEELRKLWRQRFAQTWNPVQLDQVIANGGIYVHEDGTEEAFELPVLESILASKSAAQTRLLTEQSNLLGIGNPQDLTLEHANWLRKLPPAPPGTQLWRAKQSYQAMVNLTAHTMKDMEPGTPEFFEASRLAFSGLSQARESVQTAIDAEATRLGAGDKFKTQLIRQQMSGETAPVDLIQEETINRLVTNKSVADIHGPETGNLLLRRFNEELTALQTANMTTAAGAMGAVDPASLRTQAAATAYASIIQDAAAPYVQEGIPAQVEDPSHPLHGLVSTSEFAGLESEANRQGEADFMNQFGWNDEQLQQFYQGVAIDGKDLNSHGAILGVLQSSALFDRIAAAFDVEMAEKVANWWGSANAKEFTTRFANTVAAQAVSAPTTSGYVSGSLAAPQVQQQLQLWGIASQEGIRDFSTDYLDRQLGAFRAFGNEPTNYQVAALSNDSELSDLDRKTAMTNIFVPLLNAARQQGLNYAATNIFIERSLREMKPADPATAALLKQILKNRPTSAGAIEEVIQLQTEFSAYSTRGMNARIPTPRRINPRTRWFDELNIQLNQPRNPRMGQGR